MMMIMINDNDNDYDYHCMVQLLFLDSVLVYEKCIMMIFLIIKY